LVFYLSEYCTKNHFSIYITFLIFYLPFHVLSFSFCVPSILQNIIHCYTENDFPKMLISPELAELAEALYYLYSDLDFHAFRISKDIRTFTWLRMGNRM